MRNLYGLYCADGHRWGLATNKRVALRHARAWSCEVRVIRNVDQSTYYDAPTFYVLGERIADYRTKGQRRACTESCRCTRRTTMDYPNGE